MATARILIVEDKEITAKDIASTLKKAGYLIAAVVSSKEDATQQADETRPDLVLMDIHLGDNIDGIEAAEYIYTQLDIPVVYLTAYADEETLQQAKLTAPFGYILKPFSEKELHSTIEMALYKHKTEKRLRTSEAHLEELVENRTAELKQINEQLQQEILERIHAERALRASERQYRFLVENAADGIAILREEKLVFVNNALISIFGYTLEQFLRTNPLDLVRDDYRKLIGEKIESAEKGTVEQRWQIPCITADSREIWLEIGYSFIEWEGKSAILVIVRDITEGKLREIAMEEEQEHLRREIITLRSTIKDRYKFGEIIGKSQVMQDMYALIVKAAATDANLVISGKTGVGKELVAWTIHSMSDRKHKPFLPVNCGAIPDTLFEREFFGHRKGAFTGAHADQPGFFDRTHQGTLFLDEVGEIPPNIQVKLLRVLESGEYTPVGSNIVKKANVRIIAATNKNVEDLVQQKFMREDFFYRIHVITITVPSLRERKEDIPLLIDHFLEHYENSKKQLALPGEILEQLYAYDWPGNVRELQNVLHRYLTIGHLDFRSVHEAKPGKKGESPDTEVLQESLKFREAMEDFEKQLIIKALNQHGWHRSETAETLGIPTRTLHRKMKKYHLIRPYRKSSTKNHI